MEKVDLAAVVTAAVATAATQVASDPDNKMSQKDVPAVIEAAKTVAVPLIKEAQAKYDYATNNESLVTSYSFTGGLAAALGALSAITIQLADGYQPVVDNGPLIPQIVALAGVAWVLYGRLFRSKPIGK